MSRFEHWARREGLAKGLPLGARIMLLDLAARCDDSGCFEATNPEMADALLVSERSVTAYRKLLVESGLVRLSGGIGHVSTTYHLLLGSEQ